MRDLAAEVRARLVEARAAEHAAKEPMALTPPVKLVQLRAETMTLKSLVEWIETEEAKAEVQMRQTQGLPHDNPDTVRGYCARVDCDHEGAWSRAQGETLPCPKCGGRMVPHGEMNDPRR